MGGWLASYDAKRWHGINVVDPGAVPGGSTILSFMQYYLHMCLRKWGRNRIDTRNKGAFTVSGIVSAVIGLFYKRKR